MVKKKNHLRNQTNKQTNNRTNNNKNEKVIPLTSILPVSKNLRSKHIPFTLWNDFIYYVPFLFRSNCFLLI